MQDEDFDTDRYDEKSSNIQGGNPNEDLYEERTHKVVYRRSSTHRQDFSRTEDGEDQEDASTKSNPFSRGPERQHEKQDRFGRDLPDKPSRSWPLRPEEYDQRPPTMSKSDERNSTYYAVAKWQVDYNNKNYIRSKLNKPGGFHRYGLGRPLDWDIEYDNMYYLRSFVNDPKGLHRQKQDIKRKRVPDKDPLADSTGWELEYGPEFNQQEGDVPYMPEERRVSRGAYRYYGVRRNASDSDRKVHEKQLDFKELNKEELKYGPEFLQRDVQHILEQKDRRIGRGGYRSYDAERNVYDERPADPQGVDYRESYATLGEISEVSEDEEDVPKGKPFKHTVLKKIVTLGTPLSVENVRYSTHLKFVPGEGSRSFYEGHSLRKSGSQAKKHLSSGAESRAFSVGNSSRTGMQSKKNPSASTFKTAKTNSYSRRTPSHGLGRNARDFDEKDYWNETNDRESRTSGKNVRRSKNESGRVDYKEKAKKRSSYERLKAFKKPSYQDTDRGYKQRDSHEKQSSKGASIYKMRKQDDQGFSNATTSRRKHEHTDFEEETMDEDDVFKKFPPHVEERIYTIRKKMSRPEILSSQEKGSRKHHHSHGKSHKEGYQRNLKSQGKRLPEYIDFDDHIDFKKHLKHPHDQGKSVKKGYERYVNENGSEIWVKTEESYAELHHL